MAFRLGAKRSFVRNPDLQLHSEFQLSDLDFRSQTGFLFVNQSLPEFPPREHLRLKRWRLIKNLSRNLLGGKNKFSSRAGLDEKFNEKPSLSLTFSFFLPLPTFPLLTLTLFPFLILSISFSLSHSLYLILSISVSLVLFLILSLSIARTNSLSSFSQL